MIDIDISMLIAPSCRPAQDLAPDSGGCPRLTASKPSGTLPAPLEVLDLASPAKEARRFEWRSLPNFARGLSH